jgi:hypothetical protein
MKEERLQILKMIESKQITAEEGTKLIQALEAGARKERERTPESPTAARGGGQPRWFRVRITDMNSGRQKVNVNIPVSLVSVGIRMGARFVPEMAGVDVHQAMEAIKNGQVGKIVDIADDQEGERVEIYVE